PTVAFFTAGAVSDRAWRLANVIRPCRTRSARTAKGLCITTSPKPIRYRHPPVAPERARSNFDARSRLASFVFVRIDHPHHAPHQSLIKSHVDQFGKTAIFLDIRLEDGIQNLVGRE